MATVLFELILTRLFSITSGYHFAFMIVSMTMFGMTLGAIVSMVRIPVDAETTRGALIQNACLLGVTIPLTFFLHNYVDGLMAQIGPFAWIAISFALLSIPFYFAGVCMSLCLTRFSDVGNLYCADLLGAGLSCPILVWGLSYVDAQDILTAAGVIAAVSAVCFAFFANDCMEKRRYMPAVIASVIAFGCFLLPRPAVNIHADNPIELVKWSPVGRVVVTELEGPAVTWGKVSVKSPPVPQKGLYIDFGALTVMTTANATAQQLEPIKEDITALGNSLRPDRSLFVIGVGGGRDILTGLLFNQRFIDGVEVNPAIVSMLKNKYAEFVGNLATKGGVNIVNDEARNWLARSGKKYGVIQCSLVDTWSASSSGAFMLTENVLYTKEAFELYINHLAPGGILSFLRWGDEHEPGQILRMLDLGKNALHSIGINDFATHMMLVSAPYRDGDHWIGNLFVSNQPFSDADKQLVANTARERGYKLLWVDGMAAVEPFASSIKADSVIDPGMPSDDRPFFFTPIKPSANESSIAEPAAGRGLALLFFTFAMAAFLVIATILVPVGATMRGKVGASKEVLASGLYFSCLGLSFMLVEVGQIERLTIFLGNPTYGLSVVLFALLLSSGIGSFIVNRLLEKGAPLRELAFIGLISSAVLISISALISGLCLGQLDAAPIIERILLSIALVCMPGFFMGWAFPLGMTMFNKTGTGGSWFWAVNGATSVLGSIVAAIFSITVGIKMTLFIGAGCYILALIAVPNSVDATKT
jgi:hypothetical protein